MTLKEFLKECQDNAGPYYRFMDLNGPDRGAGNTTYLGASMFFYRREKRAKIEKKQKANDKKRKVTEQREEKTKKVKNGLDLLKRIQETELEDKGEVYDDCDDIRKKISEFLGEKS